MIPGAGDGPLLRGRSVAGLEYEGNVCDSGGAGDRFLKIPTAGDRLLTMPGIGDADLPIGA